MNKSYKTITIITAVVIVIVIITIVYHFYDPTNSIYAPKCVIKLITGYDCPSCGSQRLMYSWAHGNFVDGVKYNYFIPFGLLYLFFIFIGRWIPKINRICTSNIAIYTFIVVYCLWWVGRNILHV